MSERTALYRHFSADGTLLYVGISLSAIARLCQHRETAAWYDDIARVEIEWFSSRDAAIEAEKHAIKTERPAHNIIHAKSASHEDDEEEFKPVWPIPAKHAVIAWGFDRNPVPGEGVGAVAVGYQPYKCGSPKWFENYISTCGAGDSSREELSDIQRKIAVLADYFMLTHVYEIDPRVATAALMNIREFRDAIESSPKGYNLLNSDCAYIAKKYPVHTQRFWHSVHVFPASAMAVNK